ncbi:ricin-agglutinin family protein [Ricinus communis]|uniref:rRNA N-glycosylase n=1 Tax=Ricinus communis TaxID=3988 RepID=B9T5U2_RICCO|nr:ricin-agglutinin family protein [Ricinus communis]
MQLGGNTIIIWIYSVATWLWFGSTSGWSFTLGDNNILPNYKLHHCGCHCAKLHKLYRCCAHSTLKSGRAFCYIGDGCANAYVVGYRAGNYAYFFRPDNSEDAEAITLLFIDAQNPYTFTFGGNYDRLEQLGGLRENIELANDPLEDAISALYYYSTGGTQLPTLARSFIVCIQMASEAVRFQYIGGRNTHKNSTQSKICTRS